MLMTSLLALSLCFAAEDLIPNGGFENGLADWSDLWTREPNTGQVALDRDVFHTGNTSARIEHQGSRDWSYDPNLDLEVTAGELLEFEAWIRLQGTGNAMLCVATQDAENRVIAWSFAARTTRATDDWRRLHSRFVVPTNVTHIRPRFIGVGPATVWLDDCSLQRKGNVIAMREAQLPEELILQNETLSVTVRTSDTTLSVRDLRTGNIWEQHPFAQEMILQSAESRGDRKLEMQLIHTPSGLSIEAQLGLDPDASELVFELRSGGELASSVRFPEPFVTQAGTYLVVPMNEGISYPVEDASINPMRLIAYGGHGICMPFWGATDGVQAQMAILETPDDASIRIERVDDKLCILPEWESQKGRFGYSRRLRYVFFNAGGHVAICKRYRHHSQETGLFKTLEQKQLENPDVDRLIGAVNVWCWDRDGASMTREMQSLGIERILWSHRDQPDGIAEMNAMGVLTSRYDIYQDVMDPANFDNLRGVHPDWTTAAWPADLMLDADGEWVRGWRVKGKDGNFYPCGVLCDHRAPEYARKRIQDELSTHLYRSRFIDTTTASPWRECYHPDHPMTRSESKHWKMGLLRVVSEEMGLVTGCETGHDASVPYLHYFEGMLSLGPYRVPDAGRDMIRPWQEVPERVAKFQVGHQYRLPLWELVYHDCVVAQWYWGDYNNKLPALWDKRDLFNLLYGTPPMFMFNREIWEEHKERFVQSYQTVCPTVRKVGYAEMLEHRFLTVDRAVQQTVFADGTTITVNFGSDTHYLDDGTEVTSMGYSIASELPE